MEGQQIPRNEGGREEYHNIPHESMGSPSKVNINRVRQELPFFSGQYERTEMSFQLEALLRCLL